MSYKTDQERFWAGNFGNEYISRNSANECLVPDIHFFSNIFGNMDHVSSLMEFGANVGLNLQAMKVLMPDLFCAAVEINENAAARLRKQADQVYAMSILDYVPERKYDVVLCKGILIHVNPDFLPDVYRKMYESSGRYIIIAEYYNPSPVTISYRGNSDRLFKRDFAGEMLDLFPDLRLKKYGFQYHRDVNFPMDDITWFLLEK